MCPPGPRIYQEVAGGVSRRRSRRPKELLTEIRTPCQSARKVLRLIAGQVESRRAPVSAPPCCEWVSILGELLLRSAEHLFMHDLGCLGTCRLPFGHCALLGASASRCALESLAAWASGSCCTVALIIGSLPLACACAPGQAALYCSRSSCVGTAVSYKPG